MATVTTFLFLPVILFIIVGVAVVAAAVIALTRSRTQTQQTQRFRSKHQRYTPGQFSSQMELDLRLPYRRFRQLYPGTRLTYEEYKRLQMQSAFRRSMSSQENKRMVR